MTGKSRQLHNDVWPFWGRPTLARCSIGQTRSRPSTIPQALQCPPPLRRPQSLHGASSSVQERCTPFPVRVRVSRSPPTPLPLHDRVDRHCRSAAAKTRRARASSWNCWSAESVPTQQAEKWRTRVPRSARRRFLLTGCGTENGPTTSDAPFGAIAMPEMLRWSES